MKTDLLLKSFKSIFIIIILCALTSFASCGLFEDDACEDFEELRILQERTINGLPMGSMTLYIMGDVIKGYPSDLITLLNDFNYWYDLYNYECEEYGISDKWYLEEAEYYSNILEGYYREAKNVILEFDGSSNFLIKLVPVDINSTVPEFNLLSITDLAPGDINTEITLDSSSANRNLRIEYKSDVFSSLEAGSSAKITIHNIRPVGQMVLVDINATTTLFKEGGSMESISFDGSIYAYREQ
ncbi:hypothetical protein ACFL20_12525 [Spirochaetota bacterium]